MPLSIQTVVCGVSLLVVVCLLGQTQAYLPRPEAKRLCRLRTGLTDRDISDYKTRNEDCTIDCITMQGTVMTAYADDGNSCHDAEGYKCVLGKCRSPDDKLNDEIKSDLSEVQLTIKSAFVADRDPYPGQGESDAFVIVEVVSDGEPTYNDGEVVCYTHVVQDNIKPRWNFSCKPLPMKSSTKLRFVVLDSDKPDTNPQLLGSITQSLDSLMNTSGAQSLTLDKGDLPGGPYTLEVDVKAKRYTPSD